MGKQGALSARIAFGAAVLCAALLGWASLGSGCASIRLHRAMERLNDRYVGLFYDLETASPAEIRASARSVRESLDDPAITDGLAAPAHAPAYRQYLEETRGTLDLIVREAAAEPRDPLLNLRSRLHGNCQSCHADFRR